MVWLDCLVPYGSFGDGLVVSDVLLCILDEMKNLIFWI